MATISKAELQAVLRLDFALFVERSFQELNPQTEYRHNWHIEVIADALEQCRVGKLKRLIINVPPRSLKSHMASIAFPAYVLGHNPSTKIICVSYAQDLANNLSGECRSLLISPWYQELFPATRLASRRSMVSDYATPGGGFRLSTSVGGVLTGRGADFIIIDDPLKPDEALSETQRQAVNDWYDHTLVSRLNDKRAGCIILIMQRLHEDDLVGHVIQQGDWHLLRFPAIAEEDEHYSIQIPYAERTLTFSRRQGEALHPERESLELLAQIRAIQGEYNFAGQYQQSPAPLGGGMVKAHWFQRYTTAELPKEFEMIFQSWDTANKSAELNDYSVCTTWGVHENHLYLLHVLRERLDYPELRRVVKQHASLYKAKNILIEDKASGTQLIQDLQADGIYPTTKYSTLMDKVMRMHSASSMIANGFVHIPEQAYWLAEYLHEMAVFPNGRYDDQADSTSEALDWFKQGMDCLGFIEYLKMQAAKGNGLMPVPAPNLLPKAAKLPVSRPCEKCNGVMNQVIAGGLRCEQCGSQWLNPDTQPRVQYPTRTDFLNGKTRWHRWI